MARVEIVIVSQVLWALGTVGMLYVIMTQVRRGDVPEHVGYGIKVHRCQGLGWRVGG